MTAFDRLLVSLDGHDAYEVLGVDPSSSDAQIRRAFRERARHVHPDVSGDPGTRMTLINSAYSMLRSSRPDYDLHRRQGGQRPPPTRTAPGRGTAGSLWDDDTADGDDPTTEASSFRGAEEERASRTDSEFGSLWDVDWPSHGRNTGQYGHQTGQYGHQTGQYGHQTGQFGYQTQFGYQNAVPYPAGGYPPRRNGSAAVHTHMWLAVICLLVCLPAGFASVHLSSKAGLLARFGDERAARHAAQRSLTTSLAGIGVIAVLMLAVIWPY